MRRTDEQGGAAAAPGRGRRTQCGHPRADPSVWDDWQHGYAHTVPDDRAWPIWYSPTVTATIAGWHAAGLADIRWLTTWQQDAAGELTDLLELPTFPVEGVFDFEQASRPVRSREQLDTDGFRSHGAFTGASTVSAHVVRWWKFDAVLRLLIEDPARPVVWIDDELANHGEAQRWLHEHATSFPVAPYPAVGLSRPVLQAVTAFLESHRER